jgi:hypothetical protein
LSIISSFYDRSRSGDLAKGLLFELRQGWINHGVGCK